MTYNLKIIGIMSAIVYASRGDSERSDYEHAEQTRERETHEAVRTAMLLWDYSEMDIREIEALEDEDES